MALYVISYPAEIDLNEIYDYVALDDAEAALRLIIRLQAQFEKLAERPYSGRRRDELAAGLRSFPESRYVIFYRIYQDSLEIVRVLHGSRDLASIFDN